MSRPRRKPLSEIGIGVGVFGFLMWGPVLPVLIITGCTSQNGCYATLFIEAVHLSVSLVILLASLLSWRGHRARQGTPAGPERPTGLTIISVIWMLEGAFGVLAAVGDLQNLFPSPPFSLNSFPWWFVGFNAYVGGSQAVLAIFTIVVTIGLLRIRRWSYRGGLALPLLALAFGVVTIGLAAGLGLPDVLYASLAELPIAVAWVVVVWTYFHRPFVRGFLESGQSADA